MSAERDPIGGGEAEAEWIYDHAWQDCTGDQDASHTAGLLAVAAHAAAAERARIVAALRGPMLGPAAKPVAAWIEKGGWR